MNSPERLGKGDGCVREATAGSAGSMTEAQGAKGQLGEPWSSVAWSGRELGKADDGLSTYSG